MKNKRNARPVYVNSHAGIESRPNYDAQFGGITFTQNREDGFGAAIATDSSNVTDFNVQVGPVALELSGRQARTLQRLLNKHYENCGASPAILGASDVL